MTSSSIVQLITRVVVASLKDRSTFSLSPFVISASDVPGYFHLPTFTALNAYSPDFPRKGYMSLKTFAFFVSKVFTMYTEQVSFHLTCSDAYTNRNVKGKLLKLN